MADADPVGATGVALYLAREKDRPDTSVRSGLMHRGQARSYKRMRGLMTRDLAGRRTKTVRLDRLD